MNYSDDTEKKLKISSKRHINIPVFVVHLGCPNDCVFCNQKIISGHMKFDLQKSENEIIEALKTIDPETETEIAFFGGSFTGIPREQMTALLDTAQKYVNTGRVQSIRLSTRPDYIDDEILDILSRYSVKTIELGIQSTSDRVLEACSRGHTAEQTVNACRKIKERGFSLVGQMMTGLPLSSMEDEIHTAETICSLNADGARIYPTVVLKGTKLHKMMLEGKYTPPTLGQTVQRAGEVLDVFISHGVHVIRIGLCAADNLTGSNGMECDAAAGEYSPAAGEMAKSYVYRKRIIQQLEKYQKKDLEGKVLTIEVPKGRISAVCGQRKSNKIFIRNEYNVKNVKLIENPELSEYNIYIR